MEQPTSRASAVSSVRWGSGGLSFELRSESSQLVEHARAVMSPWSQTDGRHIGAWTAIPDPGGSSWTIQAPETTLALPPEYQCTHIQGDHRQVVKSMEFQAVATAVLGPQAPLGFHAALVAGDSGAVAIVGIKEAGKSTLATSLWLAGHQLLSDDGLVLDEQWRASPIPRRCRLRPESRAHFPDQLWEQLSQDPTSLWDKDGSLLFHPHVGSRPQAPLPLKAIVLLSAEPGPLESLSEAEALTRLLVHSYLFAERGIGGTLVSLGPLFEAVPCYSMGRGPLTQRVKEVEALLG